MAVLKKANDINKDCNKRANDGPEQPEQVQEDRVRQLMELNCLGLPVLPSPLIDMYASPDHERRWLGEWSEKGQGLLCLSGGVAGNRSGRSTGSSASNRTAGIVSDAVGTAGNPGSSGPSAAGSLGGSRTGNAGGDNAHGDNGAAGTMMHAAHTSAGVGHEFRASCEDRHQHQEAE